MCHGQVGSRRIVVIAAAYSRGAQTKLLLYAELQTRRRVFFAVVKRIIAARDQMLAGRIIDLSLMKLCLKIQSNISKLNIHQLSFCGNRTHKHIWQIQNNNNKSARLS